MDIVKILKTLGIMTGIISIILGFYVVAYRYPGVVVGTIVVIFLVYYFAYIFHEIYKHLK